MGFILDGLDTESYDRQYKDSDLVKRIFSYFKAYHSQMMLVALALTLNAAAGSGGPILISKALDLVSKSPGFQLVFILSLGVILLGGLGWLFNFISQKITAKIIGNVVLALRIDVFKKTIEHNLSFYDEHPSGKIVSRITSDTQDFSQVVSLVIDVASQFIMVFILIIFLLTINLWLTIILIGMAPVAILIAIQFRKIARKVTRNSKRMTAKINAQIQESISGIMVAKSFRQEGALHKQFQISNQQAYAVGIRKGAVMNLIFPAIGIAAGVGTAVIMYAAGYGIKLGGMTPGNWYLFMQAVGFFWWPILNIASFWSQFQDGLSASERVFALMDLETSVKQTGSNRIKDFRGKIEFKNVFFSYNHKETVLEDFSLTIHPAETVALVGHTGAGKSSIARLITRFYEFQGGQILVDGMDTRSLDLDDYRAHIGLVPQDPFLFSGTVGDNIRYSRPQASDQQVLFAATHVGKGDWIEDLPQGLNTDVGQRGGNLSMGQRQLVALARVLLKDPTVFILDEATASVDPFTEVQIQEGLASVMESRTAIVIAHRLSTIKKADRILVLEKGRVIEEGNHESLLKKAGHYAFLYNTYFRHQSMEYVEEKIE